MHGRRRIGGLEDAQDEYPEDPEDGEDRQRHDQGAERRETGGALHVLFVAGIEGARYLRRQRLVDAGQRQHDQPCRAVGDEHRAR
ncbi:MAG: hypothetical protein J0I66_01415, partial [Microbacterium sp.]|nr:hypothetical protein [Microbacterium sp.]